MFNLGNTLKRAWQILWNYKGLWIFAFLFALAGGVGGGGGGGGNTGYRFSENYRNTDHYRNFQFNPQFSELNHWFQQNIQPWFATEEKAITTILWIVGTLVVLGILVGLLLALVRYPAETAMIRMTDEYDRSGVQYKFKQGWKLGWNRRAFRIWVIDLIISIPAILFVLLIVGAVLITFLGGQYTQRATLPAMIIALFCLALPFALLMAFLWLLRQFVIRAAALEDTSIGESFKAGWDLFKRNWKNALLMWLVVIGVGMVGGIALMLAFFILIPTYAIMAIPGAIVAAVPGAIGYGVTSLFNAQVWPWIIGGLVALPFFFIIAFSPLTFVAGIYQLFITNVWTVTYRSFKQMSVMPVPAVNPPPLPEIKE